jgi:hypothetical protein
MSFSLKGLFNKENVTKFLSPATAIGSLFPKKEGGSTVGNIIRTATSAALNSYVPGTGDIANAFLNPVPQAPEPVQEAAKSAINWVASMPAQDSSTAFQIASSAASKMLSLGATQSEADKVQTAVQSIAQDPPVKAPVTVKLSELDDLLGASKALGTPLNETEEAVNKLALQKNTTKENILTILKDGATAAKDAMIQSWLDKTEAGQDTKKEAIWTQVEKYAPFGLAAIGLWFVARRMK